ncbi:hypothetical protein B484DRAFT_107012 [Ochromonadaceae sp. CCMP2298]|nr:hypothetical protein B484DRAFT_107012 [Ochromonadaceae sp. CCMP2298]
MREGGGVEAEPITHLFYLAGLTFISFLTIPVPVPSAITSNSCACGTDTHFWGVGYFFMAHFLYCYTILLLLYNVKCLRSTGLQGYRVAGLQEIYCLTVNFKFNTGFRHSFIALFWQWSVEKVYCV